MRLHRTHSYPDDDRGWRREGSTSPAPTQTDVNNSFCADAQTPFIPSSDSVHPTVTLDYATMVASGFNGVFYVDKSSAVEPASCLVKGGLSRSEYSNYPWVIPSDEQEAGDLPIVGSDDFDSEGNPLKGLPDQSTAFASRGVNVQNTPENAYASLDALTSRLNARNITPQITDGYYVNVAGQIDPVLHRYTGKEQGELGPD